MTSTLDQLTADATPQTLARATAENHRAWFAASARAAGGDTRETNGVTWTRTPDEVIIPFPRLKEADPGATLDAILAECRAYGVKKASCWVTRPIRDLGARLLARGFEWGWRPHWMVADLHQLPEIACSDGLEITVDEEGLGEVHELPYNDPESGAKIRALNAQTPRRTWHFVARLNGQPVGHSLIHVSSGPLGIAGVYNVGVVTEFRRRGIGTAVMVAACQKARDLGCRYAGLNSAADGLYLPLGFRSCGWGQSWWMHESAFKQAATTPAQVAFVEAIGRGDVAALEGLPPWSLPADWDAPLLCGLTPMGVAVVTGQRAAMDWLEARGATLTVLHAWDSGQKRRVPELLVLNPALVNHRSGAISTTPLHEAVLCGDLRLARLLLRFRPDMTIRDTAYNGTPLSWSRYFPSREMVELLEAAAGEKGKPASG